MRGGARRDVRRDHDALERAEEGAGWLIESGPQ